MLKFNYCIDCNKYDICNNQKKITGEGCIYFQFKSMEDFECESDARKYFGVEPFVAKHIEFPQAPLKTGIILKGKSKMSRFAYWIKRNWIPECIGLLFIAFIVACGIALTEIKNWRESLPEITTTKSEVVEEQYYTPNRQSDIQPFLVSKKIGDKTTEKYQKIIDTFNDFNTKNSRRCNNLKYVEYHLENDGLVFEVINY